MENRSRTIDLIVIIATALAMIAIMALTLGSLSHTERAWTVSPSFNPESGEYLSESVILQKVGTIDSIYIKIGNVYSTDKNGNIVLTMDKSSSKTQVEKYQNYIAANREIIHLSPKDQNRGFAPGWYLLKDNLSISDTYVRFMTEQSFEFEEVLFVDKDGKILSAVCFGGFESGKFYSFDEKSDTFGAVADAQSSVVFDSKHLPSDKEEGLLKTIDNLFSFNGSYVSDRFTPAAAVLSGIGTLLFGNTPFGLRFVSFIFTFATFIAVYFFAKKLFKGCLYGIIAELVWFLGGMGITLGGIACATPIALFFVIMAFSFGYDFYTEKKAVYAFSSYKKLLLAGLFIAIAGGVDIFALASMPALAVYCVLLLVKQILPLSDEYKRASGLEKEYLREKYVKAVSYTVVGLVLSFILLPLLCLFIPYGLFYNVYSSYYNTQGVFAVMFANLSAIVANNVGSLSVGWLIGFGSEAQTGLVERVVSANKAVVVISFALSVLYAVLYILNFKKKIKNSELSFAITDEFGALFAFSAFIITFIVGFLGGVKADYSTFAYSLLFMSLALTYSYKLYNGRVNRIAFGALLTSIIVVISVFFCLSVVCFLGIAIPENVARYLYGWMM